MNAITVHAPFGSMVSFGHKTIEVRSHDRFKGLVGQRIAIHQGMKLDLAVYRYLFSKGNNHEQTYT